MKKKTSSKPASPSGTSSTAVKKSKASAKPKVAAKPALTKLAAKPAPTKPVAKTVAKSSAAKTSAKSKPTSNAKKSGKLTAPDKAQDTVEPDTAATVSSKAAKPVMAEVVYENVGPTPVHPLHDEEELQPDKAYSVPTDDLLELDEDIEAADDSGKEDGDKKDLKSLVPAESRGGITSTDPLAIYLNDIRKYPVLSKEKELEIAKRYYETKDPEAAQTLIKSNLRFVVKVAADYSRFGAKMIDLIQEGNVGLMHAVREYNPYKGARLITYAVWWIRGYIQEYLMRQYSMVRIGTTQNQRRLFYQLQREKEALDAMGQEPNIKLLSSRLGIPEDEIEQMSQRMSGRDVSLDRPMDDDSGSSLMDLQRSTSDMSLDEKLAYEEQLAILKEKIAALRPELSEREKIILDERILNDEPLTLQEIGEKHGITREAVRQMEARVLKKIKTVMDSESENS